MKNLSMLFRSSASSTPPTTEESSTKRRERDEFDFSSGDEDTTRSGYSISCEFRGDYSHIGAPRPKRKGDGLIPPWDEVAERQRALEDRQRMRREREMLRMQQQQQQMEGGQNDDVDASICYYH